MEKLSKRAKKVREREVPPHSLRAFRKKLPVSRDDYFQLPSNSVGETRKGCTRATGLFLGSDHG